MMNKIEKREEVIALMAKENYISLVRRNAIYLPIKDPYHGYTFKSISEMDKKRRKQNSTLLASFLINISSLGLSLSEEAITTLLEIDYDELKIYLTDLIPVLKMYKGDDVKYIPFYKNFPEEVVEMDEGELFINRILHYITYGTLEKEEYSDFDERLPKKIDYENMQKLSIIIHKKSYEDIFINLISSKTSISQQDRDDISFYVINHPMILLRLSACEIPMKENLAFLTSLAISHVDRTDSLYISLIENLGKKYKTATDVLRLYVEMSGGDVSLKKPTKFISLKRKERRFLMDLLSNIPYENMREDMKRYKEYWKQAGKQIKPNSFRDPDYGIVRQVFFEIRNNTKFITWGGRLQWNIDEKQWNKVLDLLKDRPGEFARRLDYLLRNVENPTKVVKQFSTVVRELPSRVLIQLITHFKERDNVDYRVFLPKGGEASIYNIPNELPPIEEKYKKYIIQLCENVLVEKFSKEKKYMGSVYLSEEFKNFMIPSSQRSASTATKLCTRGSRFKLKEDTIGIRSFIWWTNNEDDYPVDIDLSASFFDEELNFTDTVAYFNQKIIEEESEYDFIAVSSGDIINGGPIDGDGVAEFIDIQFPKHYDPKRRYICVLVHLYSSHNSKLSNLNARAGYMEKSDTIDTEQPYEYKKITEDQRDYYYRPLNETNKTIKNYLREERNRIFNPALVETKFNLSGDQYSLPFIIDTKEREIIWADLNSGATTYQRQSNNTLTTLSKTQANLYSVLNMKGMSLYDLILLNVKGRGVLVDKKEDADIIFDIKDGITPFQLDIIMNDYM